MPTKKRGNYRGRKIKRKLKKQAQRTDGHRQTRLTTQSFYPQRRPWKALVPSDWYDRVHVPPPPYRRPWSSFAPPNWKPAYLPRYRTPPIRQTPLYKTKFKQTPTRRSYNGAFYPVNRK